MSFQFRPAKRENVPLLIGLAGGTGSGKTMSALKLARGLSGGKPFAGIDTENGRMSHYADMFPELQVGELAAPFRPERYAEAIEAADKAGFPVIVVDSMSHEWAGDGGMLDWQEEEYQRLGAKEAVKMTAWIKPKSGHKKMVTRLLQIRAHVILCFRAEAKVEMVKNQQGKWEIVPKRSLVGLDGWIPITEKNLPYELTLSFLFTADHPGIPKPIKLQEQHRALVPLDGPLGEETGAALAKWAVGGAQASSGGGDIAIPVPESPAEDVARLLELAAELAIDEATVTPAIEKNRQHHAAAPDEHRAWLIEQIAKMQAAVDAQQPEEPSQFEIPAGAR